ERVGAVGRGLHRALLRRQQPVAHGEAAHLVELGPGDGHDQTPPARSRSRFSAGGPDLRVRAARRSSPATRSWFRSRNVSGSTTPPESRRRSDAFVMGRPPSPATTVVTWAPLPARAERTSAETMPPAPSENARS